MKVFIAAVQSQIDKMMSGDVFEVYFDKDILWNLYLDSFPLGTNEIFRSRREYDCNSCRRFIQNIGGMISIVDGEIQTIWDVDVPYPYDAVCKALSTYIKGQPITNLFVRQEAKIGEVSNRDTHNSDIVWNHFNYKLRKCLVDDANQFRSNIRSSVDVFKRALVEFSDKTIKTVLDLIEQNQIFRGDQYKNILEAFSSYHAQQIWKSDIVFWQVVAKQRYDVMHIRNSAIGTLLQDIQSGMELEQALRRYESVTAPVNYKRPKPLFTESQKEAARKTVSELGLKLERRFARVEDITINNLLFANRDVRSVIDPFDQLKSKVKVPNYADKVDLNTFVSEVLSGCQSVEVFVENKHKSNLVSLIAPCENGPNLFQWNNNFSWVYNGNVTSEIKERVKTAGGFVDGVMRFSLMWNHEEYDPNDLDAHCFIKNNGSLRGHIYFSNQRSMGGTLDVDNTYPTRNTPAVENIYWKSTPQDGNYTFSVDKWADRGGSCDFKAQLQIKDKLYDYSHEGKFSELDIVRITVKNGEYEVTHLLDHSESKDSFWDINSGEFVPVSAIMYSPNSWDSDVGTKHIFLMLQNCKNPDNVSGFFNEYLRGDLKEHSRVFEALRSIMTVKDEGGQLSGLGFAVTQRNSFKVRINKQRVIEVMI